MQNFPHPAPPQRRRRRLTFLPVHLLHLGFGLFLLGSTLLDYYIAGRGQSAPGVVLEKRVRQTRSAIWPFRCARPQFSVKFRFTTLQARAVESWDFWLTGPDYQNLREEGPVTIRYLPLWPRLNLTDRQPDWRPELANCDFFFVVLGATISVIGAAGLLRALRPPTRGRPGLSR